MGGAGADLVELLVPDSAAWRDWLAENHDRSPGVWLVLHKKGGSVTSMTYQQALDEALCFGWIDGQGKRRDEQSSLVRMTPRRSRSIWSARNVEHIARLEGEGRMQPAGRAAVDAAKADGRWDRAYASPANAQVPADLAEAVAADPAAQATFEGLSSTNRYALIYRVISVKRAETRTRKIKQYVEMLARGETLYPQKPKRS